MSSFVFCRSANSFTLKKNDELRLISVEENVTAFTPIEYRLLCALLETGVAEDQRLIKQAFGISEANKAARKSLEKHIEHVRLKLQPTRLRIGRVYKHGYALVAL
jgi:DNA-binding response OmpR family regulator